MEELYTSLPKKAYLASLKQGFCNPFDVFSERVTGIVVGPFFSVAHYQDWEWNRKISSECNRAFGFVSQAHGETKILFFRGKGLLSPLWLLGLAISFVLFILCVAPVDEIAPGDWWGIFGCAVVCSLTVCGTTAIQACLTDKGQAGAREITKFLQDPEHYYC